MNNFCGLDFGTSNSAIGFYQDNQLKLSDFDGKKYLPSSIFFEYGESQPFFGEEAKRRYIAGSEGRMIWSPKNALGTKLINEKTQVENKKLSYTDIIALIIGNLKERCERQKGSLLSNIVVGRPVHYNDNDKNLDKSAQDAMHELLKNLGFKNICFELEPIAAAAHYENDLSHEEIALIIDMGGGTSDFTIAQLGGKQLNNEAKILAVGGIHIAGTNFDKSLSLKSIMPQLGLNTFYKSLEGNRSLVPKTLYTDLATWHKIGFCYQRKNLEWAKKLSFCGEEPEKFKILLQVLEARLGHQLAIEVEKAKIQLSSQEKALVLINELDPHLELEIERIIFEQALQIDLEKIIAAMKETIKSAQINADAIDAIFMTGGASSVPLVRNSMLACLPKARLVEGDKFASVATGLSIIAKKKFGT
ncbi:MAG: Hsp70 family protein [Myxococcales bacterium]|nr:Hsp70 family protein [Myxococcales bacterium]USN50430.1 MAG: Hsp70 family protein [Myxococcales bacterium]